MSNFLSLKLCKCNINLALTAKQRQLRTKELKQMTVHKTTQETQSKPQDNTHEKSRESDTQFLIWCNETATIEMMRKDEEKTNKQKRQD